MIGLTIRTVANGYRRRGFRRLISMNDKIRAALVTYKDGLKHELIVSQELANKLNGHIDATAYKAASVAYALAIANLAVVFDALESEH